MYTAEKIAEYVIAYSDKKNYLCSNLRLQKILYFIQAYFLKIQGKPCFRDDMEAWDFGPVIPSVYRRYVHFGAIDIFLWDKPSVRLESEEDRRIIEQVVELLAPYSSTQLLRMTQSQQPWRRNYCGIGKHRIIPLRDIQEFVEERTKVKS